MIGELLDVKDRSTESPLKCWIANPDLIHTPLESASTSEIDVPAIAELSEFHNDHESDANRKSPQFVATHTAPSCPASIPLTK